MTFVGGRIPSTRGALIRLRETLDFIKRGKNLLEAKRDQLAAEVNRILGELKRRKELESRLCSSYRKVLKAIAIHGYSEVYSMASSVKNIEVEVKPYSIIGVVVPKIEVSGKPSVNSISDADICDVAKELTSILDELLEVAELEACLERVAVELMSTDRKLNALEKIVIPSYEKMIRYIEDRLFEETLEEFVKAKYIRDVISRRRGG
ncbi:V-type ATP synthase subunit D [Candidatus Bathyarchaeota archaeon]|nr:V-type ATP synthase subunit D [Candidatus Bathyarchaeota archaeon]